MTAVPHLVGTIGGCLVLVGAIVGLITVYLVGPRSCPECESDELTGAVSLGLPLWLCNDCGTVHGPAAHLNDLFDGDEFDAWAAPDRYSIAGWVTAWRGWLAQRDA